MIRFTNLSCSAAEAVCLTDSGVWITTLFQVPFITGYAGSGSVPVTTFRKPNVPAEMRLPQKKKDVICVNIRPDPVRKTTGMPVVNIPEAANIVLQYGGVSIALSNDLEEQMAVGRRIWTGLF